jgi:D-sedoheptulose 7-phosphate isomerase
MVEKINKIIENSIATKQELLNQSEQIDLVVELCVKALRKGNAIYWCGNGGSAADAQHLAAELSGRFYYDRDPLPSDALHCNTSYITAVGNDYHYDVIYSRLLKGIGKRGDVLIGLSTSGKSKNVVNAFNEANNMGIITIGFTGKNSNSFENSCDFIINAPSTDTPRIQECHMLVGHIVCQLIENKMFPNETNV